MDLFLIVTTLLVALCTSPVAFVVLAFMWIKLKTKQQKNQILFAKGKD